MEHSDKDSDNAMYLYEGGDDTKQPKPVFQIIKESVAGAMTKVATTLHQQAEKSAEPQLTNVGHQAASWMEKSADYVQEFDPQKMRADVANQVQRNPAKSLLMAGAAGLVLGAIFRRRR